MAVLVWSSIGQKRHFTAFGNDFAKRLATLRRCLLQWVFQGCDAKLHKMLTCAKIVSAGSKFFLEKLLGEILKKANNRFQRR
jgi:hypothetical protein